MSEQDKCSRKELERCTSLNISVLNENYTADELKNEIRILNGQLENEEDRVLRLGNMCKSELCVTVKRLRLRLNNQDPQWAGSRESEITDQLRERSEQEHATMFAKMAEELKHSFFTLEGAVKDQQKEFIFAGAAEGGATAGEEDHTFEVDLQDGEDDESTNAVPIVHPSRKSYGVTNTTLFWGSR